ncbi:hypothetical protein AVEN_214199-1 [Araneus ventricosus]|uniref:Uncharacterized protein n=1 Tax=Araneus ventricosus TaxID=182803 RepID=A0A4Y2FT28_ARAVE|nr:hypothetical protein AVEN_214199-1 [Araneus ventricosus]
MAALQLLHQHSSLISKVYETFHSTKSMTHFIAQSLHVPAHKQSGQQSAHMYAAHRFLDIQIISNKLGVAPVVHHLTLMYISQYSPLDMGNSFCLVVKMLDSGPKGVRLYPAAKALNNLRTFAKRVRKNSKAGLPVVSMYDLIKYRAHVPSLPAGLPDLIITTKLHVQSVAPYMLKNE